MLAPPKKKKIIIIIRIILSLVLDMIDHEVYDSPEERVARLVGHAEFLMNEWDENEANWTAEQNTLWSIVDEIHTAHDPAALEQPVTSDYERWEEELGTAITNL